MSDRLPLQESELAVPWAKVAQLIAIGNRMSDLLDTLDPNSDVAMEWDQARYACAPEQERAEGRLLMAETLSGRAVDLVTNYRSRYGYPPRVALVAEFWWRVEHLGVYRGGDGGLFGYVRRFAYVRRKAWERREALDG